MKLTDEQIHSLWTANSSGASGDVVRFARALLAHPNHSGDGGEKAHRVAGELYAISNDMRYQNNRRAIFEAILAREYGDPVAEIFDRQDAGFERCYEALGITDDRERSWSSLVMAVNDAQADPQDGGDKRIEATPHALYDAIEEVLLHYRMSNLQDDRGGGYPLVDHLTTPAASDIGSGQFEVRLICDEIYNEVLMKAALASSKIVAYMHRWPGCAWELSFADDAGKCIAEHSKATPLVPVGGQCVHEAGKACFNAAHPAAAALEAVDQSIFVQPVPDHCDWIVWRGSYYGLPITQPATAQPPINRKGI